MLLIHQRVLWLVGAIPRLARVTVVHGQTVDLEFGDGSERGHVPVTQLEALASFDPLPFEPSPSNKIWVQGIDSQEGMGNL